MTRHRSRHRFPMAEKLAMREELHRRFPLCFAAKGAEKRPLKLCINQDIAQRAPDLDPDLVYAAIGDYQRGRTYLRNLVLGALRVGLDGLCAGSVTRSQAWRAELRLRARAQEHEAYLARLAQPPADDGDVEQVHEEAA